MKLESKLNDPTWWLQHALSDLYFFCRNVACTSEDPTPGYKELYRPTHKPLCDFITKWAHPGQKLLILLSRGFLKSSIVTVGWLCQRILRNLVLGQREQWLVNNATFPNARMLLGRLKFNLQRNDLIGGLFRQWLPKDFEKETEHWTQDDINIKGNLVEIGSAEGNLVSKHYNGGEINDDLVNWENSRTMDQIRKIIEWWSLSQSLLMPKSIEITLGTIWDPADLYCWQIKEFFKMPKEEFKKSLNEWHRGEYHLFRMGCFQQPEARKFSTFPTMFSDEKLHELERQQRSRFGGQYLNDPTITVDSIFKREWFKKWLPGDIAPIRDTYFLIDAANKEKAENDFTGFVVVDLGSDHKIYVQQASQEHITDLKLANEIIDKAMVFQPIVIAIEDNKCSTIRDILEILVPRRLKDGSVPDALRPYVASLFGIIVEVSHKGRSKELRINNLSGWVETGKMLFSSDPDSGMDPLIDQLVTQHASNDDMKDALAYILDIVVFPGSKEPEKSALTIPMEMKMTSAEKEAAEWEALPGKGEADEFIEGLW